MTAMPSRRIAAELCPGNHAEDRGLPAPSGVDGGSEPEQRLSTFVDEAGTQLDLECGPPTVGELDDGVGFDSVVVAVVEDATVEWLGEHAEVANDERLEEEPEQVQIGEEPLGPGTERGDRERRIDEEALR